MLSFPVHLVGAALVGALAVQASTVQLDFQKHYQPAKSFGKRDSHTQLPLDNVGAALYLVQISLGTPPELLAIQFDTGSSDLWVQSPDTAWCRTNKIECKTFGTFDASNSSTYRNLTTPFLGTYGIGTTRGVYSVDTLHIGTVSLPNMTFGLATKVSADSIDPGIIGASFPPAQHAAAAGTGAEYTPFLDALVQAGAIDRRAFSVYLNDETSQSGSILLGGVDSSKYTGNLTSYPMAKNASGVHADYRIAMTGATFTDDSGNTTMLGNANMSVPVILDTGTTRLYLPSAMAASLSKGFGAVSQDGVLYVDCAYNKSNASLSFQFGGPGSPSYAIPINQTISPSTGQQFPDGSDACQFYVEPASEADLTAESDTVYILGDPFLRSVYAVFDQDALQISLAKPVWGKIGEGDVHDIPSGTSGLPSVAATYSVTPTSLPFPPTSAASATASSATGTGSAAATQTGSAGATQLSLTQNPGSATFSLQTSATAASGSATSSASASNGAVVFVARDVQGWTLLTGLLALIGLM